MTIKQFNAIFDAYFEEMVSEGMTESDAVAMAVKRAEEAVQDEEAED